MRLKERILIFFSLCFWSIVLFWYTAFIGFFTLVPIGVVYLFVGGKKHA